MIGPDLDLFGDPLPGPRGPGRPRHRPSRHLRTQVCKLVAKGVSQERIAAALGITKPTLLRNYHEELGSQSRLWLRRKLADQEKNDER